MQCGDGFDLGAQCLLCLLKIVHALEVEPERRTVADQFTKAQRLAA